MTLLSTRTASWLALSGAAALLLAGCATPAADSSGGDAGSDAGTSDAPADTASDTCPTVPQEGYELFTTDFITSAPPSGFLYKAGTPIEFGLSLGAGFTPSMSISYINDAGDAIPEGDYNLFDDDDNGTYSNDLGIFNSDADGKFGFATISLVNDGSFTPPADQADHNIIDIGRYCVKFEVK